MREKPFTSRQDRALENTLWGIVSIVCVGGLRGGGTRQGDVDSVAP